VVNSSGYLDITCGEGGSRREVTRNLQYAVKSFNNRSTCGPSRRQKDAENLIWGLDIVHARVISGNITKIGGGVSDEEHTIDWEKRFCTEFSSDHCGGGKDGPIRMRQWGADQT